MSSPTQLNFPHRRFNPLTREWVLVSPHRAQRPWLGQVEKSPPENLPAYDPTCYLCPGNERAAGRKNPDYPSTFVFDNDFAALLPPTDRPVLEVNPLFTAEPEAGLCRVICFSPRHDLTLPELSPADVEAVVQTWTEQTRELGEREYIRYVQVFENKGAMMGCSNPHPHSQVWASSHLPTEPAKELLAQSDYRRDHDRCLLCDYLAAETKSGERIVAANSHFAALVPFWAVWPFEILLIAQRHLGALTDLTPPEVTALADLLRRVTARYDNLFEISFPYSMGFHQAPPRSAPAERTPSMLTAPSSALDVSRRGRRPEQLSELEAWHFHAHFYPPLLRSATVKKFMVGYEMLAMPQRDLTAETAAERLRGLSEQHYRAR